MDVKQAFTEYLIKRQTEYKKRQIKLQEQADKDYKAYLSMTINSYHTKKGGRYPRKVYGYL